MAVVAIGALTGAAAADEPPSSGQALNPTIADALAPVLADWIARSRDTAIAEGVREIPADIRKSLAGYVPEATLNRVRWRVRGTGAASLQNNIFAFGEVQAVTLDYVIVFADEKSALEDPKLWAHELKHVMQFSQWGVPQFAVRYLRDDAAVETEAVEYRWEFMKLRGLVPPPAPVR